MIVKNIWASPGDGFFIYFPMEELQSFVEQMARIEKLLLLR